MLAACHAPQRLTVRRACLAPLDGTSIIGRAVAHTQPDSSGWHPFQQRSCFYPSERLSLEPRETRLDWQGAGVHRTILAPRQETGKGRGPSIPWPKPRGFLAHVL